MNEFVSVGMYLSGGRCDDPMGWTGGHERARALRYADEVW